MNNKPSFRELFDSARATLAYKVEKAIIAFTEQIIGKMETNGLSRTAFASRLESSPAYVTKLLRGGTNFTLESMIKVSDALDCDLRVDLVPRISAQDWFVLVENSRQPERTEIQVWSQLKDSSIRERGGLMHITSSLPPQLFDRENQENQYQQLY
jgi:transcriptional regulator with XRE-family HTH domain